MAPSKSRPTTTILRGGRLIDPASGLDATGDIVLEGGRVAEMSTARGALSTRADAEVLECSGLIVTPGLIDPHVHLREPGGEHKETIATGVAAAAAGGFTTVCCMPNTNPCLDNAALVAFVHQRAAAAGLTRVFVAGAATEGRKGERLAPMASMAAEGAVAFTDDGDGIESASMMHKVLATCASLGKVFMQHAQERTMTAGGAMNAGAVATRLGLGGWPAVAEELMVERDVRINQGIRARYHVQHVSSGGTVEILRRARAAGHTVSGEAAPHHLLLTDEACEGFDTNAKMNPPLRSRADVEALIAGVADGTIDVLSTDHAPHSTDEKALDFASAPFGIVGLECALALYAKALVHSGAIDWARLIALMTINPARLLGIEATGLGSLRQGGPADVTVIDPELAWTIRTADFKSKSRNCPYDGWSVKGKATAAFVAGRRIL
ncbi:MAG: dihydroorotase [Planctomycetota bacterium]|nr:dihydroorotase [Planctomycetota bacterium]MDA1105539.1 dihydroorotase [Planctomycetota bacterium]